ncbi:MAG: leucine-rich repeat protein [Oscillospiraceae bacterium]|nr:leucine-rich repeat protein [Oscillospiraceae bacterium]
MKKKILSLALVLVFALSLAPVSFALTEGDYKYTIQAGVAIIDEYIGSGGDVVIPSTIAGKTVTEIGENAFWYVKTIGKVTIPNTVTKINGGVFRYSSLTEIIIPDSVRVIANYAFAEAALLKSVVIPDSVESIGDGVFFDCDSLQNVKLPSTLEMITHNMFQDCDSLTEISIPETVTKLGNDAFFSCVNLESIIIPSKVKEIPWSCFELCRKLTKVDLPYGLETIGEDAFARTESLSSIVIPTTVKKIGMSAFFGSGLEELVIPYGVTTYNGNLGEMYNTTAVYIPSTVKSPGLHVHSSPNLVIYCAAGSDAEKKCISEKYSYDIDASVDTLINVTYNGKRVSFGTYGQNPISENGRTLVPLRSIFEAMGASVDWDQDSQTVTAKLGSTTVKLQIGSSTLYRNGEAVTLDVPAKAISGRTLVPVRAVAESFGAAVEWNQAGAVVQIKK